MSFFQNNIFQIFNKPLYLLFLLEIKKVMDFEQEDIYKELVQRFEEMIRNDVFIFFDSEEYQDIILYYIEKDKITMAKKALDYALHQYPLDLDILVFQAEIFIIEEKFDTALELLNQLEAQENKHYEVLYQKAVALSRKGNHRLAIDYFTRASFYTTDKDEPFINIGIEYIFLQEYAKATDFFQKALQYQPLEMVALQNLLFCYEVQNLQQKGIDFLNNFIDKYPYNSWAWQQLGKFYYNIGEFKKSAEASDMAIVINPKALHAYLEKAFALEKIKEYKEAIDTYLLVIELFKPTSYVYSRIGYCYMQLKNVNLGREFFEKALQLDPKFELVLLHLLEIYISVSEFELAKSIAEKLIELEANNYTYWKKLGLICIEIHDFNTACLSFEKAIEYGEKNVEVHLLYAQILLLLKQPEKAVKVLKNIEDKAPALVFVYFIAAYFALDNTDVALSYLYKLLDFDPEEVIVLYDRFPEIWKRKEVQEIIFSK